MLVIKCKGKNLWSTFYTLQLCHGKYCPIKDIK
jgi:hypothetical protein